MERVVRLFAVENLLDGEDLQARVGAAVGGFVESGFGGFAGSWAWSVRQSR